jgi:tRNA-uridine 2-sulfurtransferase
MRILVSMSGGVDSSVIAHMLKEQGHDLIGVRFTIWQDPLAPPIAQILPSKCCNAQTIARANKVAEDLGIPFHHIDLSKEFKRDVVDPFLNEYKSGKTPNPCVVCNRTIKFGRMIEIANEFGCEKIASGHYARVMHDKNDDTYHLQEAVDKTKDQSYYLCQLTQEQLSRALFPLGEIHKKDVLALARKYGVPLPKLYQESQDVCFYPEKSPREFLDRHLNPKTGDIFDISGKKRGTHRGLPHYTEGQREGLGIGGLKIPLHVVAKNASSNTITVGTKEEAAKQELTADHLNWISDEPERNKEHTYEARIRSQGPKYKGTLVHDGRTLNFTFDKPQIGISPGQFIVLYRGEEIVGGGVISAL